MQPVRLFDIALRVTAGCTGLLLLYAAFFLYEDEEGQIQNLLEDMWVQVKLNAENPSETGVRLFRGAAGLATKAFDRLLGPKLISIQSVAVSYWYMNVSLAIFAPLALKAFTPSFTYLLTTAGWALVMGALPAIFQRRWAKALTAIPVFVFFIIVAIYAVLTPEDLWERGPTMETVLLAVVVAFMVSNLGFVAANRMVLRWGYANAGELQAVLIILLNVVFVVAVIFCYQFLRAGPPDWAQNGPIAFWVIVLGLAATGGLFDGVAGLVVIVLMLATLTHRIWWHVAARPIYAFYRHRVIKNSKLLGTVGFSLLLVAFPNIHWLEMVGKILGLK